MAKKALDVAVFDGTRLRMAILCGAESTLKREAFEGIKEALERVHGRVDVLVFDGDRASLAQVLDELRTFSLMQAHKLVAVDSADEFVKEHRDAIERYAANPVDNATLVLRSELWNSPKLDKLVEKVGVKLKCDPMKPADAKSWAVRRAEETHNLKLGSQAADMMVARLGTDMGRLDSELAKLAVMVEPGKPIPLELVESMVAKGAEEEAWEIQGVVLTALLSLVRSGGATRGGPGPGGRGPSEPEASARGRPSVGPQGKAIEKIYELVELSSQADVMVTYFVADLIRKLYQACLMLKQGASEQAVGNESRIFPFDRRAQFVQIAKAMSERTAGRLFDDIVDMDRRGKSGLGTPMRNLERFCAGLADHFG